MQSIPALLPPAVTQRVRQHYALSDETTSLPPGVSERIWDRFHTDALYRKRVTDQAVDLQTHIVTPGSDWGQWPESIEECVIIGFMLGIWLRDYVEELILELPEAILSELETEGIEKGQELEELLIERLIRSKEGNADPTD
jgi:hypothetical protein